MRIAVVAAAVCLSIVGLSSADDAKASMRLPTQIPAQSLGSALKSLAQTRDIQVLYFSEAVKDIRTGGAVGELTTDEALTQLLSGTGLTYRYVSDTAITILPTSEASAAGAAAGQPTTAPENSTPGDAQKEGKKSSSDPFRVAQVDQGTSASAATVEKQASRQKAVALEEVVVTAQKREERLQDVPVPVTALDAGDLVATNQLKLSDYYTRVPGLNVAPAGPTQTLSIRGITTGQAGNPSVGVVIDEVPYGSFTTVGGGNYIPNIDPGDLAGIEVLRGPQGTLYGAASMGGLIKYRTLDPSTAKSGGFLAIGMSDVSHGAEPGYNIRGAINLPLSDTLALRASAFDHRDPGYIDNPTLGRDGVNEARGFGGRLSALWLPSDAISLKLSAMYQNFKNDGNDLVNSSPQSRALQFDSVLPAIDALGYSVRAQAYDATLNARWGIYQLTSVSGFNINAFTQGGDFTPFLGAFFQGTYGAGGAPVSTTSSNRKFTQELRLGAPLGSKADWLVGAFYAHESSPDTVTNDFVQDTTTGSIVTTFVSIFAPVTYEEYALFTDVTLHFTNRFDLQVGGRESRINQSAGQTLSGDAVGGQTIVTPDVKAKANAFTYLFTPQFRVSPNLMTYARFASGYRAGGANLDPDVPRQYSPDKTKTYEFGLKGDVGQRTLSFDASIYYIDWTDIQMLVVDQATLTHSYITNGTRAKSQGLELTLESRPRQRTSLRLSGSWDDAVLTEALPATSTVLGADGDRLPYSPNFSGSLSAEQTFSMSANMDAYLGGTVSYVGKRQGEFPNVGSRGGLPSYTRTDVLAGVRMKSWDAHVYANNLTDRRGLLFFFPSNPFNPVNTLQYIQPRTIGLELRYNFE